MHLSIEEERDLPKRKKGFIRDADVTMPDLPTKLRLIEFKDDQGRTYRLVTNRWDLSAHQIAEIYRHRWQIETFFKWVKQHIRLVKPHGYSVEAIWNQMYIALIAYALCLLIKLQLQCKQSVWQLLQLMCILCGPFMGMLYRCITPETDTNLERTARNEKGVGRKCERFQ